MGVFGFMASAGIIFAGMTIDHEKGPGATDEIHTIGTVLAIVSTFAGFIICGVKPTDADRLGGM